MDEKAEQLSAMIGEIRERVRARHPNGTMPGCGISLPDLLPLLHARDAAEGKVASIGTVNPRASGLVNGLIQRCKRLVSRALDWHVREQVEFNRAIVGCVQAAIEALSENNRALARLAEGLDQGRELNDMRAHWIQWRQEWEAKLSGAQIQFLRSLSDLQGAWQHRVTLLDESHRGYMRSQRDEYDGALKAQHAAFEATLARASEDIQKRLWADLDRARSEYEAIIHSELRLLRQKAAFAPASAAPPSEPVPGADVDWLKFGEKFRGNEEYVKRHLHLYAERFAGTADVLDIGCGRGELLETFRDGGVRAHGIDLNPDCVALCQSKGLSVEKADMFQYLSDAADNSLGGIVAVQVIEHLPPEMLPRFIALAHEKLRTDGLLALETPNPECLAIFSKHFYLDPTHAKPIPPALSAFYLEEAGFGRIEVVRLEPAVDSMPSLQELPEAFQKDFFGSLDYAVFGRKLL